MARVLFALALAVLLSACKFETSVDSAQKSRIWPPGDGKLVRFNVEPKADGPVLISSKDVQAQLRGGMTVINFAAIAFELSPQRQEPIELDEFIVQVFQPTGDGGLKLLKESEDQDLGDQELTREKPRITTPELNLEMSGVLTPCEQGCVVTIKVDYFVAVAEKKVLGMRASFKSGSSAESVPVFMRLGTGTAQRWPPAEEPGAKDKAAPEVSRSPSTRQAILGGCAWLTEAEVSAAVGRPMMYHNVVSGSNHCTLKPESGSGELFLSVAEEVNEIDSAMQMADQFESMLLGDRALWLPKVSQLHVEAGKMRFTVRTAEIDVPRPDREAAQREAVAVARQLMTKATNDQSIR